MTKHDSDARARLASIGVPAEVAALVQLEPAAAIGDDEEERASISVGYAGSRGRIETSILNVPSMEDALATLADRERIGGMLALGVRAMPASQRPRLPAWLDDCGRRLSSDLGRARGLATDAATTQDRVDRTTGPAGGDPPF